MPDIKEISVTEFSELLKANHQFEIIDIRTPAEVERGVIPDAMTLPMHLIPLKLNFFIAAEKQIVIYCRTGSRAAQACRFLNQQGIHNVINLRGGIVKWSGSGLPLAMEPGPTIP
ncbi:MAG: rhodanese-like domain-containing protein [Gammaproteobacteria bacterium]|nr:rhodanese-like domain-containing protein [Gammaproteobacteria bacterium]